MNPLAALGDASAKLNSMATVDVESYYAPALNTPGGPFTLTKMTTESYVWDPRFEVIGVGVSWNGRAPVWLEHAEFAVWAKSVDWSSVAVCAHNMPFDGFILAHHFGIIPGFYLDTLSMGRALHGTSVGNSLAKLSSYYEVGEKGDEVVRAMGKRRKDFTPSEWLAYGEYCKGDVTLCAALLGKMLAGTHGAPFPEVELWNIDTTIRMFTEPKFILDSPLLETFLASERTKKADLLARVETDKSIVLSNEKFAQALFDLGVDPPTKISPRTGKETWAFAKNDPQMQDMLEDPNDDVRWLVEARIATKSTLNETRTERLLKLGAGGRPLPLGLKYAGAHTFRWSGTERLNPQNFERTDALKPEKGTIRKALLAPPGFKVVVADSAQIEARVLAWLAGHTSLVHAFAGNRDVYSEFATLIYGRQITKAHFLERHVGKASVLGLGFGMGWFKMSGTLLAGMLGGPPVQFKMHDAQTMLVDFTAYKQRLITDKLRKDRIEKMPSRIDFEARQIHCAVTEAVIRKYRQTNTPITNFWKIMDAVLGAMLDEKENAFGPNGCLRTTRHGILLPSGLVMKYPGLRYAGETGDDGDGFSYMGGQGGKQRVRAYGGLMTENVVQALARIVVADQMLYLRGAYGYCASLMTHDEAVYILPASEAELGLERILEVMKTAPDWAPGLPLNAEGGIGQNYGECK